MPKFEVKLKVSSPKFRELNKIQRRSLQNFEL
jgi:hypothetical protein